MNKLSPRMQIILSMVIFGTIGLFRRWIPFPSSVVALARSVIGLLFLLLLRMIQREPLNRAAIRRNLPKLLLLGAMLGTNWIFLFEAYNHTSVAAATMCYYMAPVFIILLSALFFGEKITPRKGLCAAVATVLPATAAKSHFVIFDNLPQDTLIMSDRSLDPHEAEKLFGQGFWTAVD